MRRPGRAVLVVVVVALLVAAGLQVGVRSFRVTSGSMAPTLGVGDRIWVERLSPRLGEVDRGDVVVFRDPGGWVAAARAADGGAAPDVADGYLVKRVVGVGGDRVGCCEDGRLTVDGQPLAEPYLPSGAVSSPLGFDRQVPDGALFVVGDDRAGSLDSRSLTSTPGGGFVPLDDVVGVVLRP